MTETLSDYEVDIMAKELRSDKEYPKGILHSRLKQALNTIEAKDQEIKTLKGQVAAFSKLKWNPIKEAPKDGTPLLARNLENVQYVVFWEVDGWSFLSLKVGGRYQFNSATEYLLLSDIEAITNMDTQAAAEAFIASTRSDEREKAIRECIELCKEEEVDHQWIGCKVFVADIDEMSDLLTKEQA